MVDEEGESKTNGAVVKKNCCGFGMQRSIKVAHSETITAHVTIKENDKKNISIALAHSTLKKFTNQIKITAKWIYFMPQFIFSHYFIYIFIAPACTHVSVISINNNNNPRKMRWLYGATTTINATFLMTELHNMVCIFSHLIINYELNNEPQISIFDVTFNEMIKYQQCKDHSFSHISVCVSACNITPIWFIVYVQFDHKIKKKL